MKAARFTGWFFLILGLLLTIPVIRGEMTGEIRYIQIKYAGGMVVKREQQPKLFRDAISGIKFQSMIYILAGLLILAIIRRLDRLDPMSRDFAGQESLDALSRDLDRERKLRNSPKPRPTMKSKQSPPVPQPKIII